MYATFKACGPYPEHTSSLEHMASNWGTAAGKASQQGMVNRKHAGFEDQTHLEHARHVATVPMA